MYSLREFIIKYPSRTLRKGESILLKDEEPRAVYIVETGIVKSYTINSSGEERLVAFCRSEEDFPIGYAFGIIDKAQYFYEAFTICKIRLVPRNDYLRYISSDIEIMHKRMARLTISLMSTHARIDALEQTKAGDKIAHTLLYMADQFGVFLRPYNTRLKLSVSQQEIANALGLTRETINVELKKLEIRKLVTHSRRSYVLYMEKLRDYMENQRK